MRGKMLFVSIALLVMLFFVEKASAQVNVATLKQLQAALAGNDEEIIVTKTIVIDEDLTLDGGGKTVKLDSNARIQLINSATFEHITIDGGELQRSNPLVVVDGNGGVTLTLGDGAIIQNARTSGNGGAIFSYVDSGSNEVNLTGGTIEGNSAKIGGGVYINCYTFVEPTTAPPVQGSEARCFRGCIQPHRRHVLRQYGDGRRRGFGDCFRQSCFAGHAGRAV